MATDQQIFAAQELFGAVEWQAYAPANADLPRAPTFISSAGIDGTVVLRDRKGNDVTESLKAGVLYPFSPNQIRTGGTLTSVNLYYAKPSGG